MVDYVRDVKPILERRCVSCHGRLKQKAGLRLDVGALIHKGGGKGSVIEVGKGEASALVKRLVAEDESERMPPESKPLPAEQVRLIARWIDQGARVPKDEVVPAGPGEHWSFQTIRRPRVPEVRNRDWVVNPVDAFVLSKLESRGWAPAGRVSGARWVRRATLDVTGLPPGLGDLENFPSDAGPRARAVWVDRLLERPQYGERWARHWFDVVRYAESNGYERDAAKPFAWRYRDYVIESLNRDKPWDRFLVEQLAGDELSDATSETVIGTTYYRLGPWDDEPADPATDRYDQLDDMVSTTSLGLMGLNLGCARCHDHKFEPFTSAEYYGLVAVFAPLERPRNGREELTLAAGSAGDVAVQEARQKAAKNGGESKGVAGVGGGVTLPQAYVMHEPNLNPAPVRVLARGLPTRPGEVVLPSTPKMLNREPMPVPVAGPRTTGRRLAFARWLTSRGHPLTARVMVNRVWQQHFGQGLVRTPNNFGVSGEAPTHPELLDWLADWFMNEAGWSLKKLHRLILTSETYAMSKASDADRMREDPENRLLWRFPYQRLEVEAIRDSMLATSGRLNLGMGGPSMYPPVPKAILEGNSDQDKIWKASGEPEASRRTVYAFLKRAMIHPMLEVLDLCDTTQTSGRRAVTTVPTQALTLFNGDFVNEQARHFAARLRVEAGPDAKRQVDLAYRLALGRRPTEVERGVMLTFLRAHGLEPLCRAIFNLNEFVYPD